jgi:hypothetical protein
MPKKGLSGRFILLSLNVHHFWPAHFALWCNSFRYASFCSFPWTISFNFQVTQRFWDLLCFPETLWIWELRIFLFGWPRSSSVGCFRSFDDISLAGTLSSEKIFSSRPSHALLIMCSGISKSVNLSHSILLNISSSPVKIMSQWESNSCFTMAKVKFSFHQKQVLHW